MSAGKADSPPLDNEAAAYVALVQEAYGKAVAERDRYKAEAEELDRKVARLEQALADRTMAHLEDRARSEGLNG